MIDCGEKISLVSSYRYPDKLVHVFGETFESAPLAEPRIIRGSTIETWRVCGKRPGHGGPHGPGSWLRRWRRRLRRTLPSYHSPP